MSRLTNRLGLRPSAPKSVYLLVLVTGCSASLLLQQGESLKYVQEQLGHSSTKMTCDTYGHLVPGGNRQAVDRLDDGNRMKTFWTRERISVPQVIERIGATRRSRTGDLLITKNTNPPFQPFST